MLYFLSETGSLTVCFKDADQINPESYIALLNHCLKGYSKYVGIQAWGPIQGKLFTVQIKDKTNPYISIEINQKSLNMEERNVYINGHQLA